MSFTTSYKDTGLAGVYFVTEPEGLGTMVDAICREWRYLCDHVDEAELERVKRSLFTNMLLLLDGSTPVCEDIGRCVARSMGGIRDHELVI